MKSVAHHAAPNIVPGLNLTSSCFLDIYAWISSMCADSVNATSRPYQYGLTRAYDGKPSLQLEKIGQNLVLSRCTGITPAGSLIGLFDDLHHPLIAEIPEGEMRPLEPYSVLIEISRLEQHTFGPDSVDMPARQCYTMPSLRLRVQPLAQATGSAPDAFCIGLLTFEAGAWNLSDYVPPCAHIGASELLRNRYRSYMEKMEEWLKLFPQIIRNTDAYPEKSMVELREFAFQLGAFLAASRYRFVHLGEKGLPFELFDLWAGFARQTSFLLQCLTGRAGFNNLLAVNMHQRNGVDFTADRWEDAIQEMANITYDHQQLIRLVQSTDQFLDIAGTVFKALSHGVKPPAAGPWKLEEERIGIRQQYSTW